MFKSYDQDIGMLSNKINKKLIHYLNSKLEKFNITTEQWLVLVKLSKQNKISQKNLAEVSSKDQSTLTRIIDILERKNFIERHPNKEDRRSIAIHITADGLGTCKKVTPFLEDIFNDILKGISYEKLKIFNEVFLQIGENIDNLKDNSHN
ncbi:MarR family transcriptional regulator [Clostridium estertheticum]|uniref:MarR family winged helix-turn-helix transcriptional regulator n=1 Tax=Clostridium estertheticum TaxID=238834 RepID=UPI001C0E21A2|nr:MarR family transcriptional regulator [Clostridium estertheticum]MBU3216049.1 MarR family transcriptional regulator [Clostridium estertheticum]WAG55963.1 MarR family transcriptional regulator [Clostridium estertheticum]